MKYTKETMSLLKTGAPMMTFGIMLEYYLSALDEIDRLQSENEWIPVSERLPEKYEPVLTIYRSNGGFSEHEIRIRIDEDTWTTPSLQDRPSFTCNILTHWRPLPQPPEAEC